MRSERKRIIVKIQKNRGPQLYTPKEKIHNCTWIFTIGDRDDQPSVPHAHSQGEGYRLNAWTGEIFPAGTERKVAIDHLSRKELSRLHKDLGFIKFAKKQIEWYKSEFPHITFMVPEWFQLKYLIEKLIRVKGVQEDETEVYIFVSHRRSK